MTGPLIALENISKDFGRVQALNNVSLEIAAGTIHGLVGENGAGKSTLMKILTGFLSRSGGRVCIDGRSVALRSPGEARRLGIGMLYQEPLDFPRLPVLDNFMAGSSQDTPARQRQIFLDLNRRFGFGLDPDRLQGRLSVGERQQVELLRLIRDGCRILILDEPTTGISSRQQHLLFTALHRLREEGHAIILVSHKLGEITTLCDRVSVLRQGRLSGGQQRPFDEQALLRAMFESIPDASPPQPPPQPGPVLLTLEDVSVSGGRTGLHRTSIDIRAGEIVGLAGLDGSGQSLFLRLAHGLLRPDRGRVRYAAPAARASRRAFLPADRLRDGLIAGLTIREHHLLAGGSRFLLTPARGRTEAAKAIGTHSIHGTPETPVEGLSGGNQQRLLLSLIPDQARLILLEHPTRGLDLRSARWTWQHLRERLPREGAIVFASPDLEEIMEQASRILVFFNGRIVLDRDRSATSLHEITRAITGRTDGPGPAREGRA